MSGNSTSGITQKYPTQHYTIHTRTHPHMHTQVSNTRVSQLVIPIYLNYEKYQSSSELSGNSTSGITQEYPTRIAQDVNTTLMPMVGQGIPVQRTSSVLATKGSFKRTRGNSDLTESNKTPEHSNNGLREKTRYFTFIY